MTVPNTKQVQREKGEFLRASSAYTGGRAAGVSGDDGHVSAGMPCQLQQSRSSDQRWTAGSMAPLIATTVCPRGTGMTICCCRQKLTSRRMSAGTNRQNCYTQHNFFRQLYCNVHPELIASDVLRLVHNKEVMTSVQWNTSKRIRAKICQQQV